MKTHKTEVERECAALTCRAGATMRSAGSFVAGGGGDSDGEEACLIGLLQKNLIIFDEEIIFLTFVG